MPKETNKKNKNTKENSTTSRITRSESASRISSTNPINDSNSPAASNKRKANQTSPLISPEAKKITQSKMSKPITLADLQSLPEKQTLFLEQRTASIKEEIRNEIKTMSDELKATFHGEITKLHDRVDAIATNVSSQLSSLRTDIDNCVNRLNGTADDLARIGKLNELKINGIAHTNNENLHEIFRSIA